MRTYDTLTPPTSRDAQALKAFLVPTSAQDIALSGDLPRHHAHGRAALANALAEGLMADEVEQILRGRMIVDAFPVRRGENPADYAARAVAEMFVAYLQ